FGACHVDVVVIGDRTPDVHHRREVHHGVDAAHRLDQRAWLADIPLVDREAAPLEPCGVLGWQRERPHAVTTVLQGSGEVPTDKAIAAGDQDLAHTPTAAAVACP